MRHNGCGRFFSIQMPHGKGYETLIVEARTEEEAHKILKGLWPEDTWELREEDGDEETQRLLSVFEW